jgi:hypothetical protein
MPGRRAHDGAGRWALGQAGARPAKPWQGRRRRKGRLPSPYICDAPGQAAELARARRRPAVVRHGDLAHAHAALQQAHVALRAARGRGRREAIAADPEPRGQALRGQRARLGDQALLRRPCAGGPQLARRGPTLKPPSACCAAARPPGAGRPRRAASQGAPGGQLAGGRCLPAGAGGRMAPVSERPQSQSGSATPKRT